MDASLMGNEKTALWMTTEQREGAESDPDSSMRAHGEERQERT